MSYPKDQLSLFDETENDVNQSCLKIFHIPEPKRKQKGTLDIKLDNLKHVKKVKILMKEKEYAMNVVLNYLM